ncbi:hypothetical protein BKH43_04345 [Helicobacter sp. 13S00401-1]|uniref:hypothetical protein n=1 Tax=Helicobacter sp. 13S00401-1 TaxID=1905758 RepID=UPI000BA5FB56|nr:hypothetical protein [Helicobacter sp. 13S00401-1]PAF50792.1 hypothetical protein BKH43_04345 [Helicobacter sp. 13S00401-1]
MRLTFSILLLSLLFVQASELKATSTKDRSEVLDSKPFVYKNRIFKFSLQGHLGSLFATSFGVANTFLGLNTSLTGKLDIYDNYQVGLGALGAWNIFPYNDYLFSDTAARFGYQSRQDIINAYLRYTNSNLTVVAGRYSLEDIKTTPLAFDNDFIYGPLQGASINYTFKSANLWLNYINSYLQTGILPKRLGSSMALLKPFNPLSKDTLIGGEILNLGGNLSYKGFYISPWVLFNTRDVSTPSILYFNPLVQAGLKSAYKFDFGHSSYSLTRLDVLFQASNLEHSLLNSSPNLATLIIFDEAFRFYYQSLAFEVGGGFLASVSSLQENGKEGALSLGVKKPTTIFALSDSTRFYGKYLNGIDYFQAGSITGYLFASMSISKLKLGALAAFGTYKELSVYLSYKIYTQKIEGINRLSLDAGLAYSYASFSKLSFSLHHASQNNSALMVFTKLSF